MHIICPQCRTSYTVEPATFGLAGRNVRCSRCREVWLAHPESLRNEALTPSIAASGADPHEDMSVWDDPGEGHVGATDTAPMVESPSIAGDWAPGRTDTAGIDWPDLAQRDHGTDEAGVVAPPSAARRRKLRLWPALPLRRASLTTVCTGMAALVLALLIWRVDVVRLLPQTAAFYNLAGLKVNLRGLAIRDVRVTTETVEGKPVLVIEGDVTSEARKPVELPRLRFVVRDAHGTEIYAWNAVLEQPVLNPGEKVWFRSRLASPPGTGASIDVRFFNRRDLAAGAV